MFQFTDSLGTPVETPIFDGLSAALGSDIANLPILLAAAEAADRAGYCGVYDDIANNLGAPTRQHLRDMGLLKRWFNVTAQATHTVTVEVPLTAIARVFASNPAEAREMVDNDEVEFEFDTQVSGREVRDAISTYAYFDADDFGNSAEVTRVRSDDGTVDED